MPTPNSKPAFNIKPLRKAVALIFLFVLFTNLSGRGMFGLGAVVFMLVFFWLVCELWLLSNRFGKKGARAFSLLAVVFCTLVVLQIVSAHRRLATIEQMKRLGATTVLQEGFLLSAPISYVVLGKNVGDQELAQIISTEAVDLTTLFVEDSPITDEAFVSLQKFPYLAYIRLQGSQVTPDGIRILQAKLPRCRIIIEK